MVPKHVAGIGSTSEHWISSTRLEVALTCVLVPRERRAGEHRVAATPETVKRLMGRGCVLWVECGAGEAAGFSDADYAAAGAELIAPDGPEARQRWGAADVVLTVQGASLADGARLEEPGSGSLSWLKAGGLLIGLLEPHGNEADRKSTRLNSSHRT